ncbi:hypothetical protein IPA_07745 [Ignicoccus pacificus DSM 13166]|uniref:CRISPR-associated protein Cmr2 N-terminal domain-containing protein n=1 Tax=Ignicoccus pacificus DSM 13166 TaxID=940294 RepID=A0A977KBU2_9CREN|nr:hypothetical protein IPA_07745 [Ignicoccus pacificus DSM 13166]
MTDDPFIEFTKNLFIKKLIALFHDPPWKAYRVGGLLERGPFCLPEYDVRVREKIDHALTEDKSVHETEGLSIIGCVLSLLKELGYNVNKEDFGELWDIVKEADGYSASIDRLVLKKDDKNKAEDIRFLSPAKTLANIFRPNLYARSSARREELSEAKVLQVLMEAIGVAKEASKHEDHEENLRRFVHVLMTILEPLWLLRTGAWGPADTRVPIHSVFDHAFATSAIASLIKEKNSRPKGYLVYVGLTGFKEWIKGSRKLSDAWISSWLSSALVWYAVKEAVWEFGPDSLLVPSSRWNPFYFSLLREKLGEDKFSLIEEYLKKVTLWEGFPYYPVNPAFAILLLPELPKKIHKETDDTTDDSEEARKKRLEKLEKYFKNKIIEGWKRILEGIYEKEGKTDFINPMFLDFLEDVFREIEEIPFAEPLVVVKDINTTPGDDFVKEWLKTWYEFLLKDIEEKKEKVKKDPRASWKGLARNVDLEKRIIERDRVLNRTFKFKERENWRYCSVCKYGMGVFAVPGRDLPNNEVSEDFKEFSKCIVKGLDEPWKAVRSIFRPGERLCPHCLVKRLAELDPYFSKVAEKLIGYPPLRRVTFPATDDIAALATRMALLDLVELEAKDRVKISESTWDELYDLVSSFPTVSKARNEVLKVAKDDKFKEAVERYYKERWWIPYILYLKIGKVIKAIESSNIDEDNRKKLYKRLLTAMLTVDIPFYQIYYGNSKFREILKNMAERIDMKKNDPGIKRRIGVIKDVLKKPRNYYSIIRFDYDNLTLVKIGIIPKRPKKVKKEEGIMYFKDYVESLVETLCEVVTCNDRKGEVEELSKFKERALKNAEEYQKYSTYPSVPSYLYTMSNSTNFTVMRWVRVTTSLGGIPIFMAGDEGLAVAPSWLPWELLNLSEEEEDEETIRERYKANLLSALDRAEDLELGNNQGLNLAILLKRIGWAAHSRYPGFHPLREGEKVVGRIPALVASGLSEGLRFAHYKDHLYAELEIAEELLELSKDNGGSSLTLGMGRGAPNKPSEVAEGASVTLDMFKPEILNRWTIGKAGELGVRLSSLLALIEEGKVSVALARGLSTYLGERLLNELLGREELDESLVRGIIERLAENHSRGRTREKVKYLLEVGSLKEVSDLLEALRISYDSEVRSGA